jgi:cell wall-associated NlpC family hydrolase
MVTGQQLVDKALVMDGRPYIYGYEDDLEDPHPKAADCSELVQWTCYQCGVYPIVPDGAIYQYRHCKNYDTLIDVEEAIRTVGALLFVIDGDHHHVAFSQGNGLTMECRGRKYGCGQFDANRPGWTHGALVPGVKYNA